ncbi:hypothetical protein KC343_g1593 [Hortaea werneckii]|uniref:Uncharacterized protein n=1 Tax=Hortaea werneckii TaxID=91943 RepID=A0A3M7FHH0_HORWE|nr:hypothetical protein KC323_g3801 [Hortaea werneckii]KAI7191437.1 hypothetical protein KC352_g21542 [Hortaea werneckii]KAI7359642.1 hypothetical protein KC320_g362 [Hortaea werneckii]KAI7572115.1 hypothetical protein KC317_g1046 [Hortaea werneckii]KAI7625864.1 hypothetical protein KC346_g1545 [Hortaea werneckii]
MDEAPKQSHQAAHSSQGGATDTQTLGLAPANQDESQYRLSPTGSPHNLRDMNPSSADEIDSKTAAPGSSEGSFVDEGLASNENLQRRAVSGINDNGKDANPSDTTTTADDIIKVKESDALMTLQRTYGMMLEMQRELFDLQQRHLAKTQAIFADIERLLEG